MSHGSLKDTIKSLQTAFAADVQSLNPLPDELQQTVEAYLERNPRTDETDAQKLHEELLSIHNKYVAPSPDKLSAFVHILRLLQPALRGDRRIEDWWLLVIRPVIDAIGHKRDTIEDAREFLLGILLFDEDDDASGSNASLSAKFTDRVLEAYMARSKLPTLEGEEVSPENEFIAQELESILVAFGKKKPLALLKAIDVELVKKECRLQALSLLSSFVRLQPPHLHLVLETSIINHLFNCLLIDLSGTVVDLALTVLIMFIPHITPSLYASLPKLFLIYARISCWDQYTTESTEPPKESSGSSPSDSEKQSDGLVDSTSRALESNADWEPLQRLFNTVEAIVPKANYLFTFLYGLFPLNFMQFIRKPRRYLKMKNYPNADNLNLYQDLLRKRTETHRITHRLHPSFFNTTPEDELTDNRLLKMDPADLVTECLSLCITVANSLNHPGPPPTAKLPELPKQRARKLSIRHQDPLLLSDEDALTTTASPTTEFRSYNSWRNTQSTTLTAPSSTYNGAEFPLPPGQEQSREASPRPIEGTSPPKEGSLSRPVSRRSDTKTPRSRKTYSSPSDIEAVPKLQLFAQSLTGSPRNSDSPVGGDTYSVTVLQREVMLLKNDLNFERFQKAQYLAQIGQLQRKHLTEATTESQTQTLLNKNRTLSDKLKRADDLYAQLKKETSMSRSQAKKYEEQLAQKLKVYREEEKARQAEVQGLRAELDALKKECEALRSLVVKSEGQERDAKNQLGVMTVEMGEMENLRQQVVELEAKVRDYELSNFDLDQAREEHQILLAELEAAHQTVENREGELERMKKTYDQKITALENRLRNAPRAPVPTPNAPLPDSMQQMIDSALAASNAKFQTMKKNYKRLNERYIELEVKFQEMETGRMSPSSARPGSVLSLTRYADDPKMGAPMGGPAPSRYPSVRRPHAFSDPNTLLEEEVSGDEDSYNPPVYRNSTRVGTNYANKPRFESLAGLRPLPVRGISPPPLDTSQRDNNSQHDFQIGSPPTTARQSMQTLDLSTSRKITASSEVRVHGRGGAQNLGRKPSKDPSKDKKVDKPAKTGGFRGLKGIM